MQYTFSPETLASQGSIVPHPFRNRYISNDLQTYPDTTFEQLRQIFPDAIHSSYGVVALLEKAETKGGAKRYFLNEEQLLQTEEGKTIAVCNQWGIGNISPILEIAKS